MLQRSPFVLNEDVPWVGISNWERKAPILRLPNVTPLCVSLYLFTTNQWVTTSKSSNHSAPHKMRSYFPVGASHWVTSTSCRPVPKMSLRLPWLPRDFLTPLRERCRLLRTISGGLGSLLYQTLSVIRESRYSTWHKITYTSSYTFEVGPF